MNIKSTWKAFGFFLPTKYAVMYTTKEALQFWGCGQFLPFIIKRILGVKRIFPCSSGNKRIQYIINLQFFHPNRLLLKLIF